jgi:uncharacterized protein
VILEYAIYHGPLPFVRELLELGADPNCQDQAGFPALLAALSTDRPDRSQLIELLLGAGADIEARGLNDWTPLHYAAAADDLEANELLLAHGADPNVRTRIDHCATLLGEAEILGRTEAARSLRKLAQAERRAPGDFMQSDVAICRTVTSSRTSTAARCPI